MTPPTPETLAREVVEAWTRHWRNDGAYDLTAELFRWRESPDHAVPERDALIEDIAAALRRVERETEARVWREAAGSVLESAGLRETFLRRAAAAEEGKKG